ncbi:MAG: hypothetical protein FWH59_03960 [Lentimicrobiaceae bacterium]|nr:hypothetical protein [Lentimicrobiaceae bacterium]
MIISVKYFFGYTGRTYIDNLAAIPSPPNNSVTTSGERGAHQITTSQNTTNAKYSKFLPKIWNIFG